jgi:hypothetical protein
LLSNPQDGELLTKSIERGTEKVVFVLTIFKGLGHEKQIRHQHFLCDYGDDNILEK